MILPKKWKRTATGGYQGFSAGARREFDDGVEREFVIVAPDPETVCLIWNRIMAIEIDTAKIQPCALEKAS